MTEFRDHKLVLSKRGAVDGGEYLTIPLDRSASPTLLHRALLSLLAVWVLDCQ